MNMIKPAMPSAISASRKKRRSVGWYSSLSRMPPPKIPATDQRINRTFATKNVAYHIQLLGTGSGVNVTGPFGCSVPIDSENATIETMACRCR